MQTFTGQFYISKKTFDLGSQILSSVVEYSNCLHAFFFYQMQCTFLHTNNTQHENTMKIITSLFLIGKHLGKNFKFHNNVDINNDILSKFPSFYQNIFIKWINSYTAKPTLPFMILYDSKVYSKPALVNCSMIMKI